MNIESELKDHIEEMAKMFEKMYFTPMQGRILSFLSSVAPPEKTFDEIVSFFHASKSTISNSLNYLISLKLVDYKKITGKRKRYFLLTGNLPEVYSKINLEIISQLKELSYKTLTLKNLEQKEMNQIIHGWINYANMYERYLMQLMESFSEKSI